MIGMPAATLASNIRSAPLARASSKSSSPRSANIALFAVTTSLPCRNASLIQSKAPSAPVNSTTSCIAGSATTSSAFVVSKAGSMLVRRDFLRSRTAIRCREKSMCLRRRIDEGASCNNSTTPLPTVPKPINPTPIESLISLRQSLVL